MQVGSKIKEGSELHTWRHFLARSTLWLGVWLLGAAIICGIAANWEYLTKTQRFIGTQSLLAICAVAAAWLGWRLRAAEGPRRYGPDALLALAGLLLGALLALLGQTYQTGADTWELFAWWAILLLPWALVAMSQAVWLLWIVVINIAVLLYMQEGVLFGWGLDSPGQALPIAIMNLLFLAGWELAGRRWNASMVLGPRLLVLWMVGLTVTVLFFDNAPWYGLGSSLALFWIAMTVGLVMYYQRIRLDLVILATLAAGVIGMSLRVLAEGWWATVDEPWIALPLAAVLIGEAVFTARWLRHLAAPSEPHSSPAERGHHAAEPRPGVDRSRHDHTPWYVQGLLALSAWFATLLLLLFVLAAEIVTTGAAAVTVGLVLCAVAVAGLRAAAGLFGRQCLIALGFAGQILVMVGLLYPSLSASLASSTWLYVLLLGGVVYALGAEMLLRFLSAGMMAIALGMLLALHLAPEFARHGQWLDVETVGATTGWLPVAVVGAWAAAIAFYLGYYRALHAGAQEPMPVADTASRDIAGWGGIEALRPLAWAFALAVQAMAWVAAGVSLPRLPALWHGNAVVALLAVAGVLLPAICAVAVLWPRRHALTRGVLWGVPLGLLILALFWLPSPGVAFALTWMLLGFGLRDLRLSIAGGLSLLVYLLVYYYQLEIPLLDKALWLGGAALLLFVLRALVYLVPRWTRTIAPPVRTPPAPVTTSLRWRTAVVLGGLVCVLGVVNYTIWQREAVLTKGRTVVLELAPVDPRSLMQGDYMALRFAASSELGSGYDREQPPDGYLVLVPDADGVAQVVRTQADVQPLAGEETALRYRIRNHDVRIVTNAYFFPEGQADRYANARYGEVRVGEDGTGLLVRMLGADRQPL